MKKKRDDCFQRVRKCSKILLTMKLTFILLFCFSIQTFAELNAQSITMKKQNASLEEIIWELRQKDRKSVV